MVTSVETTSVDVALSLRTTYTTPLLAQVATGNTVQAAHYTMLKNFVNAVAPHTHTLTDISTLDDGRNTGKTVSATETTGVADDRTVTTVYTAGNVITAAGYTDIRSIVEALRVHNHTWTDTSG